MSDKNTGEIVLYQPDDTIRLDVMIDDETVWLTQAQMTQLFDKDKRTVSEHIGNIFREGELDKTSVVRNFRTTAPDGKSYNTNYYNLDIIISVGYRIKSVRGTQFRKWATRVLKDYLLKGYAINQRFERFENFAVETSQKLTEIEVKIDFVKQLKRSEFHDLRSKILTTNLEKTRVLPKAFTRKGSYMLATILKGDKATETTMQSRRDDTLLTVGFNLRTTNVAHTHDSPARDDTCFVSVTDYEVSSHAGLKDERSVSLSRRLKSTVNRVSSLRDFSRIICENPRHPRHLRSKILKSSI